MKGILSIFVATLLFIIGYINPLILIYGGLTLCTLDYIFTEQRAFEAELYGSLQYLKRNASTASTHGCNRAITSTSSRSNRCDTSKIKPINIMTQLDIAKAKSNLSKLLELAIKGEEIIITQDDKPVAKISPIKKPLKRGSAKGKVWMSDDFDEPLEDFQEYME